ncbi:MAG: response regulator transcription factor [Nitrospirae bacterium]|nr:MAG: response regulator transcription factor [Nitrospirota bacterium]
MIKIFLTDDHEMLRQGLRSLFEREADISVAGEAGSGAETLAKLAAVKPDLLLLDLMLPDMSGMEVLEKARQAFPGLRIIILSMYDNKVHLLEALQRGADGYIIKGSSGVTLLQGIRTVMSGRRYVCPPLTDYLLEDMAVKHSKNQPAGSVKLTFREEQVLYHTAEGLTSSDIASRLGISARTVEAHRNNLMRKLGIHNKAELIRYALEHKTQK